MNIPNINLVVYSGITITFGEAGLTSVDHSVLPPSQPSYQFSSVAQSCLTLQPHGLQHARLPCPTPGACSNSYPLSQ